MGTMAAATTPIRLTLEEYNAKYGSENGYEYWFGEVVRKGMPTVLHAVLQILLGELLYRLGYLTGGELELRVARDWRPRPDVAAFLEVQGRYPTKPIDIVVEILSDDDTMRRVIQKCGHYERIGIGQIFVFDPEGRLAWEWSRDGHTLAPVGKLQLGNGKSKRA